MKSLIVEKLNPALETVVLLRTDTKPAQATQASAGRYYCVMTLFAQAVTRGKTVIFDRETYGCPGACAGLGFGTAYDKALGGLETFSAFFSKGLEDAVDKEAYTAMADKVNPHVRKKLMEGERLYCSKERALTWITQDLPVYDFPEKYRVIKPLNELAEDETPESVIFTVNPIQFSALMTLAGSIRTGINETVTPQGGACQMLGAYVFNEAESTNPRAVLGMIDLAARINVRKILPDDVLTYALPWELFLKLEEAAEEGIFKSPLWTEL
ncbi:DUF169 domain-containing protein [Desulfoluna sp.]|uniref:DUF169 domain-containing protein n=1 Tax=Desulfoluna sp. TaxID=2045199 RepID=UPI002620C2C7|nr:DUF169 domain-containing protein [Desulfoluna sp.]